MIGPIACAPHCCSCGDAIHDDAPDQTDAWLAGMCEPCHIRDCLTCMWCEKIVAKASDLSAAREWESDSDMVCETCRISAAEKDAEEMMRAYYGGDSVGSYGASDPRFNERA